MKSINEDGNIDNASTVNIKHHIIFTLNVVVLLHIIEMVGSSTIRISDQRSLTVFVYID